MKHKIPPLTEEAREIYKKRGGEEFSVNPIYSNSTNEWLRNKTKYGWKCWYLQVFSNEPNKIDIKERCECCGKIRMDTHYHKTPLFTHHIDTNRNNNQPSNLIILCKGCHWWSHNKIKELKKYNTPPSKYPFYKIKQNEVKSC